MGHLRFAKISWLHTGVLSRGNPWSGSGPGPVGYLPAIALEHPASASPQTNAVRVQARQVGDWTKEDVLQRSPIVVQARFKAFWKCSSSAQ
jgi:hypothetical protein